jgi:hypothetical protein
MRDSMMSAVPSAADAECSYINQSTNIQSIRMHNSVRRV